jgi:hypothetical protein
MIDNIMNDVPFDYYMNIAPTDKPLWPLNRIEREVAELRKNNMSRLDCSPYSRYDHLPDEGMACTRRKEVSIRRF